MRILLDTHILLWTIAKKDRLPVKARKLIGNEENENETSNNIQFGNNNYMLL